MEPTALNPAIEVEYPLLTDRIQSTFIDTFFIILCMFGAAAVIDKFESVPDWVRITLFVLLVIIYEPLCTTFGATIGNYIKRIRVRQFINTSKRINFFQALIR